jgi:hypothetical protein
MAGVQSTTLRLVVHDTLGGANQWTWIDRTITIINGNPVFTTATYKDANSTTTAITGNDQYLIQGYSTLEVDILSADKAVAQKQATMTKYNMAIGSINTDVTYTTSNIAQNLGTLGINADATLNVKAIDSRNNSTTVPLTVHVLPYVVPQVTATAQRVNNFETSTNFHIEGVISRLTIGGTDKNTVNTSTGVRYRYKKTTDATWGSWVNKTSSTSAGNVSVTDFNVPTALDRNYAWDIQVEITDKLNTSTLNLVLPVGIPIFRIGLDGKVYNNEVQLATVDYVGQRPAKYVTTGMGGNYTGSRQVISSGATSDVLGFGISWTAGSKDELIEVCADILTTSSAGCEMFIATGSNVQVGSSHYQEGTSWETANLRGLYVVPANTTVTFKMRGKGATASITVVNALADKTNSFAGQLYATFKGTV